MGVRKHKTLIYITLKGATEVYFNEYFSYQCHGITIQRSKQPHIFVSYISYNVNNIRIHRYVVICLISKLGFGIAYSYEVWVVHGNFHFTGIYLSVVSTISGIHVLMQMVLVNMCHVRPIREVPKPLKMVQKYISCRLMSDVTEVQPPNDGNEIQPVTDELSIGEDKSNVHPANEISSILNCTQVLSDKVKSEEKEKALLQDWKSIADTFDRCFSCLSLIAQLLMTIICFGILPTLGEN